ncbi:hypothetical protein L218DRAFT_949215 [Marasmius fiardii PR-910]|nr:hypothetical protein L218DRAFT_949215 [Marasmius fiardii PR-910]
MQATLKIILFVSSAVCFGIATNPPHGKPVTDGKNLVRRNLRESVAVFRIKYVLPLQRATYYLATANECLQILSSLYTATNSLITTINSAFLAGALFSCLGGLLRLWCFRKLGESFTFELVPVGQYAKDSSSMNHPKLVTTGPYNYVRHPSYLGVWLCFIGSTMCLLVRGSWIRENGFLDTVIGKFATCSWILAAAQGFLLVTMRINDEDALMRKQFGRQWDSWSQKTKYKMIPGVF